MATKTIPTRHFLALYLCGFLYPTIPSTRAEELIRSIEVETLNENVIGQTGATWFHPKACMIPSENGEAPPIALMTQQVISGSDYFGPTHWSESRDLGRTWSEPRPIPAFDRKPVDGYDGLMAGVCDVVPEYHPQSGNVLALGHVVFYRGPRFSRNDQLPRYPVYAVRRPDGSWSERRILEWDDPRGGFIYSNNCGQRWTLPNGDILLAFTFGPKSEHRSVAGVLCSFDGERLEIKEVGPPLKLAHGRGLLEPSITRFDNRFYITIRAENDRGYHSVSDDGLHWEPKKPWTWDDGEPLTMSSTQQHWLNHSEGLFLVYTRRDSSNVNVIRWRAPLYIARVDPTSRRLIRASERVVIPMTGDGVDDPDSVALMGNFHIVNATPNESWVTVGGWLPRRDARGNLLLAKIHWTQPNQTLRYRNLQ